MQNNSSIHTSKISKSYIKSKQEITLLEWPAKSPDINAIENMGHNEIRLDNRRNQRC